MRRLVNTWILRCDDSCFVVFRLVYDRETGKPKGYGFCEYQDQETALSAMRNLNGREFSGRALRVDNAASEKNKEELKSKQLFRTNVLYFMYICKATALFLLSALEQVWEQEPPSSSLLMETASSHRKPQSPSAELWPVCRLSRCLN